MGGVMNSGLRSSLAIAGIWTTMASAETIVLKCEHWNKNLGRLPDKTYAIDFEDKTCRGVPCTISDTEFIWRMDAGSHEFRINRATGEGAHVVLRGNGMPDEIDRFKNCQVTPQKP